jgi:hypothetical protein
MSAPAMRFRKLEQAAYQTARNAYAKALSDILQKE